MNPFDLDATGLLVWGLVAHLVGDWVLQNRWIAAHKAERLTLWFYGDGMMHPPGKRIESSYWWLRHPAAYVHAGIHGVLLAFVFGWVAAPLAVVHLVIDTRVPVAWWARLIRQDGPIGNCYISADAVDPNAPWEMNFDLDDVSIRTRLDLEGLARSLRPSTAASYGANPWENAPTLLSQGLLEVDRERKLLEERMLRRSRPVFDIGMLVRMATDQVFHVVTIAAAALLISL